MWSNTDGQSSIGSVSLFSTVPFGGGRRNKAFRFEVVTAAADTFQLPLELTGTYDFHVDWGDSSSSDITVWDHADTNHSYAGAGTYVVKITGVIQGFSFTGSSDKLLIGDISSWGPLKLGNSHSYFENCANLTVSATDILDLAGTTSLYRIFAGCTSLETINVTGWDFSAVTSLRYSFLNCSALSSIDVSSVDTGAVANMQGTFNGCVLLPDLAIDAWDIAELTTANIFMVGVTLPTARYDALILSWSAQAQTIVASFHGGNSKYTGGGVVEAARDAWIAKGWVITDGGIAP